MKITNYIGPHHTAVVPVDQGPEAAGAQCVWLGHGAASPTARGGENQYFQPPEYETVRTIGPGKALRSKQIAK